MNTESIEVSGLDAIGNPAPTFMSSKSWKPTDKQNQVISLPDEIFEAMGGGAAGGGKTDLGMMIPPAREFTNHPKFKGLVMRRTFPDLEKEVIPRQQEWYPHMGAVYNETKKRWKFLSGAYIQNGHAEREQDVRKYDSAEYNYINWDECTHFTGFQYLYLSISRCRSSSPDLPAFVRAFTNPGNVGHSFFKARFVKAYPQGGRVIIDKLTKQMRMYIPFLGKDNPYLELNDPGYLTRLLGLPEVEKKAKLFGDWDSYEGQVFSEFRALHLSDEPDNAVHVIEGFPVPEFWPKFLVIDWGFAAMTWAGWGAVSPDGRLYIYRTWAWLKTLCSVWAPEIVNLTGDEHLEDIIICHSAGQHRGEELTIQEQVTKAFGDKYTIELAKKDRIGGKNLVHEYLRWMQKPKLDLKAVAFDQPLSAWIMRNKGMEAYNEYLKLFVETPDEANLPKLQIFLRGPEGRDNIELIDVIPACMPKESNPEDVEEFPGDDPYDGLRMLCKTAHRYIEQSGIAFESLKNLERLNRLNNAQTQTAYYRQLEKDEAEGSGFNSNSFSVRAHSRRGIHRYH